MGALLDQQKRIERNKRFLFLGVEAAGIICTATVSPFLGVPLIAAGIYFGWRWFEFRAKNGMRFNQRFFTFKSLRRDTLVTTLFFGEYKMHTELEQSIQNEGHELFKAIQKGPDSLFDKQYWLGRMMEWVMKDPSFKVDLFRFVDVLPALVTKEQVAKHIQEYLLKEDRELPQLMGGALKAASFSFARGLAASAIRKNVTEIAQRFIAGHDIKSAAKILSKLHAEGFTTTIDLLGEKVLSTQESDLYFERYQEVIAQLPGVTAPDQANVSIKLSALSCHLHEEDPDFSVKSAKERVLPLMRLAKFHKIFINFDVESYQTSEIVFKLFNELILSDEYRTSPNFGIVVQAYLKNSQTQLNTLLESCKTRKAPITIRLVKGGLLGL